MSAITVSGLRKEYGRVVAVHEVSFSVEPGELVALIGHNGAGKSTTIKMLTGQLLPTAGSVHLAGVDVVKQPGEAREKLGYVPEDPHLYDYLSCREFLELVASLRGQAEIDHALELAGLGEDADRLIREYSQGMRRRTALAAAVVGKPPVLVLDEALNGLDPPSASRVKAGLRGLCDGGCAVLLSTHVLDTVERLADRVIMLAHGRVVADERVSEIGSEGLERLFLERIGASHQAGPGAGA
ncbi:MAG: ABC transporter ATP-binding protein [Myxococcota bacterium]|nr:ABC transporter ATP-binding protein [Myxococcota bacterium]